MSTEKCVFCGQPATPWYWIESKQGHSCKNCGEQAKDKERPSTIPLEMWVEMNKETGVSDNELTGAQSKKALDGAPPEVIKEEKGRGDLFNVTKRTITCSDERSGWTQEDIDYAANSIRQDADEELLAEVHQEMDFCGECGTCRLHCRCNDKDEKEEN